MLPSEFADVRTGERRQASDLRGTDVGAKGGQDCVDRILSRRRVRVLRIAIVPGGSDELVSRVSHKERVPQLACVTEERSDTVLRNRGSQLWKGAGRSARGPPVSTVQSRVVTDLLA